MNLPQKTYWNLKKASIVAAAMFWLLMVVAPLGSYALSPSSLQGASIAAAPQMQQQGEEAMTTSTTVSDSAAASKCITYDPTTRLIAVVCGRATLPDIYRALNDPSILKEESNGVWVLNSNLRINKNAVLFVNSTDTRWLKINSSSPDSAYGLQILGNAKIDSVHISSWNFFSNNYAHVNTADGKTPRGYIRVEPDGTGTTSITNSELSYLGSSFSDSSQGLTFLSGNGNILRGNTIHHMWFGFYSEKIGNMIIADNNVYDNIKYGLDPHTGTHDMLIRNNTVHDNGHIGIICSVDCRNITIDGNKVSNNTGSGIMFSMNMQRSIATNNVVSNEDIGIEISQSSNNEVYKNIVKNSGEAIEVHRGASNNIVHDNLMTNSSECGIKIGDNSARNTISHNNVVGGSSDNSGSTKRAICLFGGGSLSKNQISQNKVS